REGLRGRGLNPSVSVGRHDVVAVIVNLASNVWKNKSIAGHGALPCPAVDQFRGKPVRGRVVDIGVLERERFGCAGIQELHVDQPFSLSQAACGQRERNCSPSRAMSARNISSWSGCRDSLLSPPPLLPPRLRAPSRRIGSGTRGRTTRRYSPDRLTS